MKTIAMSLAAALLLSAAPALAAAPGPDNNAKCLVGLAYMASLATQHKDELSKEAADAIPSFDKAIYYHAGVLRGRYTDAQLDPVVAAGAKAFFDTPSDARAEYIMACMQESGPMLNRVADVLSKD